MNILVVGAGYIGGPLALALHRRGHRVTAWVRRPESAAPLQAIGLATHTGDAATARPWRELDGFAQAVIFCASTSGAGPEAYPRIYRDALCRALDFAGPARFIYTSSTSVYAQNDGSAVDESSPAWPLTETGDILAEAEQRVISAYGIVLRLSGIYGSGRAVYWTRYVREGREVPGDGSRWVNMIHRDDVVGAALHVLDHPATEGQIYNTTDNQPVQLCDLLNWLADRSHRPRPRFTGVTDPDRTRGLTSKRVLNAKLRALGWNPAFPTYRDGYAPLLDAAPVSNT